MKHLIINLTKKVKDLYTENLMREIEEDTNERCPVFLHQKNSVKMFIFPKISVDSLQSLSKFPWPFFTKIEKTFLKFEWNQQKTLNSQSNLVKGEHSWKHYTLWFQTTVGPWTTWVWTSRVHLCEFFFFSLTAIVLHYLWFHISDMKLWIWRADIKLDVGFPLHVGGSWHS